MLGKNGRLLLIGAVISGAVIVLIATQIDIPLLWQALVSANYWWLIPSAALATLGLYTRALRWQALLGGGLGLTRAFHILNVAYLVNGILPMRAGEVARAFLANRGADGVPVFRTASTIVVERLIDLLTVAVFVALALVSAPGAVSEEFRTGGLMFGLLSLGGFVVLIALSARRVWAAEMFRAVAGRLPVLRRPAVLARLSTWFEHILDGLQPLTRPMALMAVLWWNTISWGLSWLTGALLMLVFYPEINPPAVFLFIASASFSVALPAVPGNVGLYEGAILLALFPFGYGSTEQGFSTALAFALVVHFLNLAVNAVLGVIGILAEGVSLSQLSQGRDDNARQG
jgi:uncharacterized protein (TIRG00374 family)